VPGQTIQPPGVLSQQPTIYHRSTPTIFQTTQRPVVVQEVILPNVREEIQPVIHRDREQLEFREELQPIYEKQIQPTLLESRNLSPEYRPEIRTGVMPVIAEGPRPSTLVESEHREQIYKAPLIEETVHKKVIEEVQPVIHRETIAPKVIHETQPIYEHVYEQPTVKYVTLPGRFDSSSSYSPYYTPSGYSQAREVQIRESQATSEYIVPQSAMGGKRWEEERWQQQQNMGQGLPPGNIQRY